ncbi:MAG: methylmalonyl Co-A mutase-associated GTPase MeaB [Candidatus Omnitrophica bacterium]|nr:methylmalonyl Co-A mutase-associated GTPase MeaB [Candidatus Omnitrophota bacterium]
MTASSKSLICGVLARDRKVIAKLISHVENAMPGVAPILAKLGAKGGRALRVGITGFPGAGKSTLIHQIAKTLSQKKYRVGIILMDPTSPFSGGALLGDRIRLRDIQLDPRVYIRSMATRGHKGGLNLAARYASDILDAAGFDFIFLETVGVGQLDIDIASYSDVTVVVMTPESGDEVQAMKAGLMEVADIFIVNKMDRDKEKIYFSRIERGLEGHSVSRNRASAPVLGVAALYGEGVDSLLRVLIRFRVKKARRKKSS